jgi:hypothetical protein
MLVLQDTKLLPIIPNTVKEIAHIAVHCDQTATQKIQRPPLKERARERIIPETSECLTTIKLISWALSPSSLVEKYLMLLSHIRRLVIHRYQLSYTLRGTLDVYIWLFNFVPILANLNIISNLR